MNSKDLDFIISQEEFMNDDQLTYMRDLLENMRCTATPTITAKSDDGEPSTNSVDQAVDEEHWLKVTYTLQNTNKITLRSEATCEVRSS